jgi:cytochrome c oxidase subunit 2
VTSNDVIHSWWVPALGIKRDAIPGFIHESWAMITTPGTYRGQCAELCGANHAFMPIVVEAMTVADFNKWVDSQTGGAPIPPPVVGAPAAALTAKPLVSTAMTKDELMKRGEATYLKTCAICHKPDGTGNPPVFPPLKHGKIVMGSVKAHLEIVLHGKPGTAMQAFGSQLSNEEIAAVITYERNALGNKKGDIVQPQDVKNAKGE